MMFFWFGKPDAEEPAADRLVEAIHIDVGGKAKSTSHLGYVVVELVVVILGG